MRKKNQCPYSCNIQWLDLFFFTNKIEKVYAAFYVMFILLEKYFTEDIFFILFLYVASKNIYLNSPRTSHSPSHFTDRHS